MTFLATYLNDVAGDERGQVADAFRQLLPGAGEYSTVAEFMAARIPAVVTAFTVDGYYEAGDGGAALWKRAAVQSSGNGKRQSADGAWWELAEHVVSVKMLGAKGDYDIATGTGTDDTAAIRESIAAAAGGSVTSTAVCRPVYFPATSNTTNSGPSVGCYRITDALQLGRDQLIYGDGRTKSVIYVDGDFNMDAEGVVILGLTGFEPGAHMRDMGIYAYQDKTITDRANLIQYPPLISARATGRFQIVNVRLSGAYDGVDTTGNSGGFWIDRLELGAFGKGLIIDGTRDFIHCGVIHFWPFGYNSGDIYTDVYGDGQTVALEVGECDSSNFEAFCSYKGQVNFTSAASDGIENQFGILQLDAGYATLNVAAGDVSIGLLYSTASNPTTSTLLTNTGGNVTIGTLRGSSSATSGTLISATGGQTVIGGGRFVFGDTSGGAKFGAVSSTGFLRVSNLHLTVPANIARSVPFIAQSGGSSTLVVDGNTISGAGTGTGSFVEIGSDNTGHVIEGNNARGWAYTLSFTTSNGLYDIPDYAFPVGTVAPNFTTNGDFSPTVTSTTGAYFRRGNRVQFDLDITFDANSYATASGTFRLGTTWPSTYSGGRGGPISLVKMENVTSSNPVAPYMQGTNILFERLASATTSAQLGTSNVPAGTSGVSFALRGEYRVR